MRPLITSRQRALAGNASAGDGHPLAARALGRRAQGSGAYITVPARRRGSKLPSLLLALALAGWGMSLGAQTDDLSGGLYPTFGNGNGTFVPAGQTALTDFQRVESIEQKIRGRLEAARYRWGPALVTPIFGLPTVAVDANCNAGLVLGGDLGDEEELQSGCDPRIVARLGVGLYLDVPLSESWIFEVGALPSYTWWQDDDSRTGYRDSYEAGFHGLFNRLSVSVVGSLDDREQIASAEFVNAAILKDARLRLDTMVQLAEKWDWWVGLEALQSRFDEQLDDSQSELLGQLNRDTTTVRTGVRVHGARAQAGILTSFERTEFVDAEEGQARDNDRLTLAVELATGWRHFTWSSLVGVTSIQGVEGSSLGDPNELVGWSDLAWRRQRWSTGVYGGRGVDYSVTAGSQLFVENRLGAFVAVDANYDLNFRAFVEERSLDYLDYQDPEIEDPRTDTSVLGLTVQLPEVRGLRTAVSVVHDDTESTLTGLDRKVTYVTGSVRLALRR